jgi:hypothetical protein
VYCRHIVWYMCLSHAMYRRYIVWYSAGIFGVCSRYEEPGPRHWDLIAAIPPFSRHAECGSSCRSEATLDASTMFTGRRISMMNWLFVVISAPWGGRLVDKGAKLGRLSAWVCPTVIPAGGLVCLGLSCDLIRTLVMCQRFACAIRSLGCG